MPDNETSKYAKVRSRPLRWLLKSPIVALISHWVFQSMLYMDPTERWFKIMLDLILTGLFYLLTFFWFPWAFALLIAFLFANTFNFLFNGHLWGILKNYGFVDKDYDVYMYYVQALMKRVENCSSIKQIYTVGSLSRQEWVPHSDFDARLLRHPGLINGIGACWFLMQERTRALFTKFPLDLYIIDSPRSLDKLRQDEIY